MKQFLIVVDIQKDFVDGALGTKEAAAMIPAAAARIRECREAGSRKAGSFIRVFQGNWKDV